MSGLKLFFESGRGDIKAENGRLVVAEDINTLVLTSQFSDARAEDGDPVDLQRPEVRGYCFERFMAINGRRWGSKYWQYTRAILTNQAVNSIDNTGRQCVQHLLDNGIVETIEVTTEQIASPQGVGQEIVYQEPGEDEPIRVRFRRLWDVIRGLS